MTAGGGAKPALSRGDAFRELDGLAGERFDPEVVKAFERAFAEGEVPRSENAADSWEHASATQGGD
jgi:HD-GYP domain-containing protein (c-di-GMP phosphodiesterase class II)